MIPFNAVQGKKKKREMHRMLHRFAFCFSNSSIKRKRLFLFINSRLIGVGYDVSLFVFFDILAFEIAVPTERQTKGQTFENQTRDKLVQSVVGRVVVVKRRRP